MKFSPKLLILWMLISSVITLLEIASGQQQGCCGCPHPLLIPYYGWWQVPPLVQFGCNWDYYSMEPEQPPSVMYDELAHKPTIERNSKPVSQPTRNLPPDNSWAPSVSKGQPNFSVKIGDVKGYDKSFPNCGKKPRHAKAQEVKVGMSSTLVQQAGQPQDNQEIWRQGQKLPQESLQGRHAEYLQNSQIHPQQFQQQYIRRRRSENFTFRVIEGEKSVNKAWPWMGAIYKSENVGMTFICGSSLISEWFILTAAHCFDAETDEGDVNPDQFSVILGNNLRWVGEEYYVAKVIFHPGYEKPKFYNDLCLLKLKKPVQMSETIIPVCIPPHGFEIELVPKIDYLTVAGWGVKEEEGAPSNVLNELTVPVFPPEECNASYTVLPENFPYGISNTFICAGHPEGGKDTCKGDSGGPMVVELPDKSWMQLGILSSGLGCARPGFPGLYTKISKFLDWIFENTDLF